ncbi:MAG: DUF4838 domain-containing protein [Clostridia bacterium]|nr:DUF4838 domain-containing protein [Clostridia bacterium]
MILAENRVPFGAIHVSENDFENIESQVWFIAGQLRYYLARITSAPFEIEKDNGQSGIYISLDKTYADDEFSLETQGDKLFIKGGKRGVIYGGYELLENLGCRFFTPECEKIPSIINLELPDVSKREKPVFEYRETDYHNTTKLTYKYATMCRVNGSSNKIPECFGGHVSYALFAHSFGILVPPEEHFAEHPEYYALIDGKRDAGSHVEWQLCLSNPDIVNIAADNIRKILKENPDKKIVSISQNDNVKHCQCEECQKIDKEEGSPVGAIIRFVNKIAEVLEPEFPDVMFDLLAYSYSRPASHLTKVRHNVCVRLCASRTCYAHSFEECTDRSHATPRPDGTATIFIEDLKEWCKICERLYVWDYTSNFPLYLMPFPNWRVLQPNLLTLTKHNVKGVFEEANRAEKGGTDFNELRNYLLCKLMWNPYCDVDAHRKEFMEYFYGAAAPYLDEYLNMLCDFVEKENYHLYIQETKRPEYLSDELLLKYNELFDKAEAAVAGDGILLARVQKARLSIRFADVYWNEIISGRFDNEKVNKFFVDLRAHDVSRMDEWCNLEGTYYGWVKGWDRGVYVNRPYRFQKESIL